ncbi:hypothetical protein VNI00_015905 [Paramarasmius palmivorus]|uniref:Uncharacterized protein n=1 Tax=Paramarasmius palmivorus TaxID=297713 RepID=A0AAW0BFZ2_9AGAR
MEYQRLLLDLQRKNPGELVHGQKLKRLSMEDSQWPNKKYFEKKGITTRREQQKYREDRDQQRRGVKIEDDETQFKLKHADEQKYRVKDELSINDHCQNTPLVNQIYG